MKEKGIAMAVMATVIVVILVVAGLGAYFLMEPRPEEDGEEEEQPSGFEWFQTGNTLPITQVQTKQSIELENNRIGTMWNNFWSFDTFTLQEVINTTILPLGSKWIHLTINELDTEGGIDWSKPEFSIDPAHDSIFTRIANNDITISYNLIFWDKENIGEEISYPRFKTEEQIQHYLDFAQFIVHHFKDRVQYYRIWNEPDIGDCLNWIEVEDYINLVKRAVPVIRQEYPEAKIMVGGTTALRAPESYEYFFSILNSDIMPLVDAIYWLPGPSFSPDYEFWRDYYYNYPSLVENIKDVASAHGFEGEYIIEGLLWCTPEMTTPGDLYKYSDIASAKYYARGIVMHFGMDVTVTTMISDPGRAAFLTVQNLCTVMAGAESVSLPIEIQSEAENIRNYSFSLSNGDKLIALWTDGVAVDNDPGVNATLTLPNFLAQEVTGIDVLTGYQQPIVTSNENGNLVIQNLLVRDYPLILHIAETSQSD